MHHRCPLRLVEPLEQLLAGRSTATGRSGDVELELGLRRRWGLRDRERAHVPPSLRPGADNRRSGRARLVAQRPLAEKCMRSETLEKSPPQVHPTAAKARFTTPPGKIIPGRRQDLVR